MDVFTKGLLFIAGASWGISYAMVRRPIPVPCTQDGRPITQDFAQKLLAARTACAEVEPVLESLSVGQSPTMSDIYGILR
jgi:hypothetical protein